jgi:hypothetical protein
LKRAGRIDEAIACYRRAASHRRLDSADDSGLAPHDSLATTSRTKLTHDIEQLEYLAAQGFDPAQAADLLHRYRGPRDALAPRAAPTEIVRLSAAERALLGPCYNRLWHVVETPALAAGPFGGWDRTATEARYLAAQPEFVVIDDFLSAEALTALRRYCLDSTFWFDFSHRGGYLAAFLDDGFDGPLLLQIADGLRRALPRAIGPHVLTHLWAYKYDSTLEGIETHGDDAAVNVNFWITPDDANLDPESGGMIVYPALAPADWRFEDFNADAARIDDFVAAIPAPPIRVAHRTNRAVLFNSSLFHRTDQFRFKPDYASRRINVTLLFGQR